MLSSPTRGARRSEKTGPKSAHYNTFEARVGAGDTRPI